MLSRAAVKGAATSLFSTAAILLHEKNEQNQWAKQKVTSAETEQVDLPVLALYYTDYLPLSGKDIQKEDDPL